MCATTNARNYLRHTLLIDAAATGAMGALLLVAASPLGSLFGLPVGFLQWLGLVLVPFAGVLAWAALRPHISRGAAWGFIGCNVLWASDSVLLLVSRWLEPTALGEAFVLVQGTVVAGLAWLQYTQMREAGRAA